jgi:serine/threonine-protein kinase
LAAPVIAGKYNLLRRLGHGGMAEVFLARLEGLQGFQKLVVVKRILPHLAQDGEFVTMFLDEARTAADLRHPNVVNIMEINRDQGTYYMAMEFLHGHDVRRLQRKVSKAKKPFPLEHAMEVVMGAASGLHYAHTKVGLNGIPLEIVHRDVSPQNILVAFTGETKVVDFGIAKAATQSEQTEVGIIKGKYAYMSPEQARGEHLDKLTDQFALGAVMWELITLRRLFKRQTEAQTLQAVISGNVPDPRRFREDCPESIAKVVLKSLEKKRTKRFKDLQEMRIALEEAMAGLGLAHSPARLGRWVSELYGDELEDEIALSEERLEDDGSSLASLPRAVEEQATRADRNKGSSSQNEATTADRKKGSKEKRPRKVRDKVPEPRPRPVKADEPTKTTGKQKKDRPPRPATQMGQTELIGPITQHIARNSRTYGWAGAAVVALLLALAFALFLILKPPSTGVVLRSDPPGARVFVNGLDQGTTTPHILRGEPGQRVKVKLVLGARVLEQEVMIPDDGKAGQVLLELPGGS